MCAMRLRFFRVYPRECGGTANKWAERHYRRGLSPRVRGNHLPPYHTGTQLRSIPASAGEPRSVCKSGRMDPVYPRECGGTECLQAWGLSYRGLSPRVRGNLGVMTSYQDGTRSIPASAGEPAGHRAWRSRRRVYPRECGGTASGERPPKSNPGLSPRVRGNRVAEGYTPARRRSIPASAGEPGTETTSISRNEVYPRECGGTRLVVESPEGVRGLSSRVRGNHIRRSFEEGVYGSIPASAGEPYDTSRLSPQKPVYPRECGGTTRAASIDVRRAGLSPRVRGNLHHSVSVLRQYGSIPASAGEPH